MLTVASGVHSACWPWRLAFPRRAAAGIAVRNLMLGLEFWYDNPLHLFLLADSYDYSRAIVQ